MKVSDLYKILENVPPEAELYVTDYEYNFLEVQSVELQYSPAGGIPCVSIVLDPFE